MVRRTWFLALVSGAVFALALPPSAVALAPPRDWVVGRLSGSVPIDPVFSQGFTVTMEVSSGPEGQSPTGSFSARTDVYHTIGGGGVSEDLVADPTCLSVSGKTAIIGFTGRVRSSDLGIDDPVGGLARVVDNGGGGSDTFEWAYNEGSSGQPDLPGPSTCATFPGSFPVVSNPAPLTDGQITVLDDGSIPQTTIIRPPQNVVTADTTPTFEFSSDDPDATFECQEGGGAVWTPCTSPHTVGPLSDGFYFFSVRAVSQDGTVDPSPPARSYQVRADACEGRAPTVGGTTGNDTLVGTPGDDVIVALDGDDVILGLGGNDLICAGPGNDTVYAGTGEDRVFGGEGNDLLRGGAGKDALFGEAGNDQLRGMDGDDVVVGGDGNDAMFGGVGNDFMLGQADSDALFGGPGDDALAGNDGDDVLVGGLGANACDGGAGTNTLIGC